MSHPKQIDPSYLIHELLAKRWSPYAFSDRPVAEEDLRALFEAARWTASSYNEQPWRYILARRSDAERFAAMVSCLVDGNQPWAKAAPVLALGCISLKFAYNGQPNVAAEHDLGAASASITFEATARGLFVHQMIGIVPDHAREVYQIPDDYRALTGLAIGYLGDSNKLPDTYKQRDLAARRRRPQPEFVFSDRWENPAKIAD